MPHFLQELPKGLLWTQERPVSACFFWGAKPSDAFLGCCRRFGRRRCYLRIHQRQSQGHTPYSCGPCCCGSPSCTSGAKVTKSAWRNLPEEQREPFRCEEVNYWSSSWAALGKRECIRGVRADKWRTRRVTPHRTPFLLHGMAKESPKYLRGGGGGCRALCGLITSWAWS